MEPIKDDAGQLQSNRWERSASECSSRHSNEQHQLVVRPRRFRSEVDSKPSSTCDLVCGGEGDHGYRESRFQPASTTHCGVQERAHRVGPSSSSSCTGRCFSCCGGGSSKTRIGATDTARCFGVTEAGWCDQQPEIGDRRAPGLTEKEEEEILQKESQPKQQQKEVQEVQAPQLILLQQLIPEFRYQLELYRALEIQGEEPRGERSLNGEGRHQEIQEALRPPDFCSQTSRGLDGQLHQCHPPEVDERWHSEDIPIEGCGDDGVHHHGGCRTEGGAGSEGGHDHPSGSGLHQPEGVGEGHGRAGNEGDSFVGGKKPRRHLGEGGKEGADSGRRGKHSSSRTHWHGLVGRGLLRHPDLLRHVWAGEPLHALKENLLDYVELSGGALSRMLRQGSFPSLPSPVGVSPDAVFPLPLMMASKMPRRGRANLVIVCINYMYTGSEVISRATPSAAQGRVHKCIFSTVSYFLRGNILASGEAAIRDYLQEDLHPYYIQGEVAMHCHLGSGQAFLNWLLRWICQRLWNHGMLAWLNKWSILVHFSYVVRPNPKPYRGLFAGWMEPIQRMWNAMLELDYKCWNRSRRSRSLKVNPFLVVPLLLLRMLKKTGRFQHFVHSMHWLTQGRCGSLDLLSCPLFVLCTFLRSVAYEYIKRMHVIFPLPQNWAPVEQVHGAPTFDS